MMFYDEGLWIRRSVSYARCLPDIVVFDDLVLIQSRMIEALMLKYCEQEPLHFRKSQKIEFA